MRLLALAPWFAALIVSASTTTPESVEEAGKHIFYMIHSGPLQPVSHAKAR